MKIFAPAKLNLTLDVLKKPDNDYHKIQTVIFEIDQFKDELNFFNTKNKDELLIANKSPLRDLKQEENLIYKAVKLLKKELNIKNKFIKIVLKKEIPISAGLGGGSSDAASTIKALNKFWNLNLSQKKLLDLAVKLGSDVPFFILGGTVFAENFGEKLTPLTPIKCLKFKIAPVQKWPDLEQEITKNKTKEMYKNLDLTLCAKNLTKTKLLLAAIKNEDPAQILKNLHNDFETLMPVPKNHHLSGSGPAIFS